MLAFWDGQVRAVCSTGRDIRCVLPHCTLWKNATTAGHQGGRGTCATPAAYCEAHPALGRLTLGDTLGVVDRNFKRSFATAARHMQRAAAARRCRPACCLRIPMAIFCLCTEHMSSIYGGNSWHFHPFPSGCGGLYGASGCHLRTTRSEPDGVLRGQDVVDVPFVICLQTLVRFTFFVDVLGVVVPIPDRPLVMENTP